MMFRRARLKNVFRTITGSLNRFFAVSAIVALGAGFLGGLEATSPDMNAAADSYMDEYDWYDLDVVNQLGFDAEEIDAIKKIEGVEKILPATVDDDVFLDSDRKRLTIRIFGMLPEKGEPEINRFKLKQGTYPKNSGECLVQMAGLYSTSLPNVGDVLTLLDGRGGKYGSEKLTVSGIVQGPMFFSAEMEPSAKGSGSLDLALYVHPDFFYEAECNHVYLTVKGARELDTWESGYRNLVDSVSHEIESSLKEKVLARFDSIGEGLGQIDEIFSEASRADEKLIEAESSAIEKHERVIDILTGSGAEKNLTDALKADVWKSGLKYRTDFSNASKSISDAFEKLGSFRENVFSVEDRRQSTGYSSYRENIEKISSLSKVFPVFFFFIALLVALTTMTRLVEEKRTEIGTLKSLGFSGFQLLGQYLSYAFLSSIFGCAVGLAIGFKLFPASVTFSYGMMYTVPLGKLPFRWEIAVPVSSIAVGVILFATAIACVPETIARPAVLMSPKAPAPGKRVLLERIGFIWKRLSFSRKVTVRNMFRYKKRLWMTLAGVAGCSALLVAGFGLRNSLQDILAVQYDELSIYNVSLLLNDDSAFENDAIIKKMLSDEKIVSDWMKVSGENVKISKGEKELAMTLYVPADENRIDSFMVLRTRKGHDEIRLDDDGVVITEKQCEVLGVKAGDEIKIENGSGFSTSVRISGITECYMYGIVYMTDGLYRKVFGKTPVFNAALCNFQDEANNQETVSSLMESPSVIYAMWIDSLLSSARKNIAAINVVVFVIIMTSGLLSVIVLYNLTNINICERKREIATLMVLGYTEKESRKYIFREINVLTVIGTLIGLLFGGPLHSLVVHAIEVDVIMWGRSVHPSSYFFAVGASIMFMLFVNLIMRKSLVKIDMVESLKAKD